MKNDDRPAALSFHSGAIIQPPQKIEKFNGRQPPQSTHKNLHLIRYVKQIDPLNYSIRYSFCLSHCGGGYDFFVYRGTTGNKMDLTRGSILNYGGLKAFIVQIKSQLL